MKRRRLMTFLLLIPLAPAACGVGSGEDLKKRPAAMDLCKYQTAIRDQGARDTCPYFPPVAALEAAYGRMGVKVDLSVEHLIWLRNAASGSDKGDRDMCENLCSTVGGGNGMGVLQQYAICRAQDLPYHGGAEVVDMRSAYYRGFGLEDYGWWKPIGQVAVNRWNLDPRQLPAAARANARYAIDKFATMPREHLRDPGKFEEILASGHEIVFAINIHGDSDDSAKGEPVWRLKPGAPPSTVNHFMLMVGYDHARRFFVVKNQWGRTDYSSRAKMLAPGWKDIVKYDGYTLVDYNYLNQCAEAHYITAVVPVDSPRFDMQRAIGQWRATFSEGGKTLMTGVLAWRRLPSAGASKPDLRIGDLTTEDGRSYRVNARLGVAGGPPGKVEFSIDFESGHLPLDSTGGTSWTGELTLPVTGGGTLGLVSAGDGKPTSRVWTASGVKLNAELVEDKNVLMGMASTPNLLVDGGFEEGPDVGDFLPIDEGSSEIPGWKVTRGQIDYLESHWKAAEGRRSLDLHGSPGYGGVEQTFKTSKKRRYRVTFELAGSPGCEFPKKGVIVSAAGRSKTFSFDSTGKTAEEMGWQAQEWEFEAVDDRTTLEIRTAEDTDPVAGPALDDVRVVAVPVGDR